MSRPSTSYALDSAIGMAMLSIALKLTATPQFSLPPDSGLVQGTMEEARLATTLIGSLTGVPAVSAEPEKSALP